MIVGIYSVFIGPMFALDLICFQIAADDIP